MKLADAMRVLGAAAAYDNRIPCNDQARAWAYALGQHRITLDEAIRGVVAHFANASDKVDYLQPNHVVWNVKLERRAGLDHSAHLELEMLRDLAATNPDDPGASIHTIHEARRRAKQGGAEVPTRLAITSKYEPDADKDARRERGAPAAREVAAAALRKAPLIRRGRTDDVTDAVRRARERAADEAFGTGRRRGRGGAPTALGDVLQSLPLPTSKENDR